MALILGVESSCDETAAAMVRDGTAILSNVVLSQQVHALYGGVVPELASREHIRTVIPVMRRAIEDAAVERRDIEGVAVTVGPGLVGALVVGLSAARSFAWCLDIPLLPIHHIEGHLFAVKLAYPDEPFRFVALVVSGGHTELLDVEGEGRYRRLGQTRDDAAGEVFDKVAKMTDLPYPGGPEVDRVAARGDPRRHTFPKARLGKETCDFSFSGVKTAVRYRLRDDPSLASPGNLPDLLAGFQESVVGALVENSRRALRRTGRDTIAVCGGVAANSRLRAALASMAAEEGARFLVPPRRLCTDNGAMIASAGEYALRAGRIAPPDQGASAHLPLPFIG